jgi:hypothetical protein
LNLENVLTKPYEIKESVEHTEDVVEEIKKEIKPKIITSNKKVEQQPVKELIVEPVTIDEGWTEVKKNKRNETPKVFDTEKFDGCNTKTQICRSVSQKIKCPYGEKCKYAHKINELNIKNCGFGINCKLVKYINKQYVNTNSMKSCCYRHPSENNENLYTRNF